MVRIAGSILAADHSRLEDEIRKAEQAGIDSIHIDVMDGRFVPNLSLGISTIASIRKTTKLAFDVHMMVEDPERYIDAVADAGADSITVHYECCTHINRTVEKIKRKGLKAGIAYNPPTLIDSIEYIHDVVDMAVIMTVDPGFGSQKFRYPVINKIIKLKGLLARLGSDIVIEVDGGVDLSNVYDVVNAGADSIVLGRRIFSSPDPRQVIEKFKSPIPLTAKAVIFDFDGIIFDSEPFQHQAFNKVLSEKQQKLLSHEEFLLYVGKTTKEIWGLIRGTMPHSPEELTLLKEKHYHALISSISINPMAGVVGIFSDLKKNGWSIALASSSPKQTLLHLLEKMGLLEYFSVIVSGEDVKKGKPFPDIYDLAAQRIGVDKNWILAVEDSENGMKSAVSAGLKCISVPNEYTKHQNFSASIARIASLVELSHISCVELLYGINPFEAVWTKESQ